MNTDMLICEFIRNVDVSSFVWRYYINEFKPGWAMPSIHAHKAIEIIFAVDGSGFMKFENDVVKIVKNNVLIVFSQKPHLFYVKKDTTCTLINIHFNLDDIKLRDNNYSGMAIFNWVSGEDTYFKFMDYGSIREVMKRIVYEMDNKRKDYEQLVKVYFCELFILLSRILEDEVNKDGEPCSTHVDNAVRFIELSLSQNLSPEIISRAIHISCDYLLHIFKDYMGFSLMEYVTIRRIDRSKELLKKTNQKITDIAMQVGISNSQYFSTLFKKYTAMTPKEYRKIANLTNNSNTNIFL